MAIETVPAHKGEWVDLVLRLDIPTQRKAVAFALAKFANPDGTKVFPGQGKVADMACLHETNARRHIKALVGAGMLIVVKRGGGRGGATNTYRLSRPLDITTLPLWLDPDMNRVENEWSGTEEHRASALGESVDNPADEPVDNAETPSGDALHSDLMDEEIPSVPARNTERFESKHRALALPDLPKTTPLPPQHPAGLRNATPSLALVPPIHNDDEVIEEVAPAPTDDELGAARAALAAMPRLVAETWRIAARVDMEASGTPLTHRGVAVRAAELAAEQATKGSATA